MSKVDRFWSHEASNIRCVRESDYDAINAELAALKAQPSAGVHLVECDACPRSDGCIGTCMKAPSNEQQPSGVVPGWLITHGRDGSIVVQKPGRGGYVASMDTDNIASSILHALASDMLADRLNPCRAQSVPEGYVMVPVEPTPEMRAVIMSGISHDHVVRIYKDMLAAAPSAQQKESGDE